MGSKPSVSGEWTDAISQKLEFYGSTIHGYAASSVALLKSWTLVLMLFLYPQSQSLDQEGMLPTLVMVRHRPSLHVSVSNLSIAISVFQIKHFSNFMGHFSNLSYTQAICSNHC